MTRNHSPLFLVGFDFVEDGGHCMCLYDDGLPENISPSSYYPARTYANGNNPGAGPIRSADDSVQKDFTCYRYLGVVSMTS